MPRKRQRVALRVLERVIIYVRVSMERNIQYTDKIQIEHGYSVAKMLNAQVVDVIIENDESGREFDTRRIMEIIERGRRGEMDGVIIIHTNRWGRNSAESQRHERLLRDTGACLIAGGQIIDTTTSSGKMAFAFQTVVDENGSVLLSEAWIRAHDNRFNRGMPHSGRPRFGYDRCPDCDRDPVNERSYVFCRTCKGILQPVKKNCDALCEVAETYGENSGTTRKINEMAARGIRAAPDKKNPHGRRMAWSDWRNILDTGFAAGYVRAQIDTSPRELQQWATVDWVLAKNPYWEEGDDPSQQYYYPGPPNWARGRHWASIPPEVWRKYILRRLEQSQPETRSATPKHSVSGLMRCCNLRTDGQLCHTSMSSHPNRCGVNFNCKRHVNSKDCPGVQVSLRRVETTIVRWLNAHAKGEQAAIDATQRKLQDQQNRSRLAELERQKREIEGKQDALAVAVAAQSVPQRSAKKLTAEYAEDLLLLDKQIKALAPTVQSAAPPSAEAFKHMVELWPQLPPEKRRKALGMVIDHIAVTKGEGNSWSKIEIVPAWAPAEQRIGRRVNWGRVITERTEESVA